MSKYRYQIDRRKLTYDPSDADLAELLSAYGSLGRRVIQLEVIRPTTDAAVPCELVVVLEETLSADRRTALSNGQA